MQGSFLKGIIEFGLVGHFVVVVVDQSSCIVLCNKAFCKYTNISITNGAYFWYVCIHCFAVFCFKITCMLIGSAVAKCQIIIRHTDIRNESKYTSKNVDIKLCKSQICWNILKYVQLMIWHLKSALFFVQPTSTDVFIQPTEIKMFAKRD